MSHHPRPGRKAQKSALVEPEPTLYELLHELPIPQTYKNHGLGFNVNALSDRELDTLTRLSQEKFTGSYLGERNRDQLLVISGEDALKQLASHGVNFPGSSNYLSKSR